MAAAAPLPDPYAVVELAPMNETLASVTTIYEATLPESVAVLPAVAIIAGGAYLETKLLQNEKWDNFWIGVGGRLNDVWHTVGGFLFGSSGAVTMTQVAGLIRLSMHVNMRATRQLITGLASRTAAVEGALYKGVKAVASSLRNVTAWTAAHLNQLRADMRAGDTIVRRYVDARFATFSHAVDARINLHTSALRAELIRDILNPLHVQVTRLSHGLDHVHSEVVGISANLKTHIGPELVAATLLAGEAAKLARAAKQWEDNCGQPMCDTMGPKTDWGKLLKRFGPSAIFAMLALIAAENPDAVEAIAVDLGHSLGPILASWAEDYIGLIQGDRAGITKQVGDRVGEFKF